MRTDRAGTEQTDDRGTGVGEVGVEGPVQVSKHPYWSDSGLFLLASFQCGANLL